MVSHTNVYVLQAVTLAPQAVQGIKSCLKKIIHQKKAHTCASIKKSWWSSFLTLIHFWSKKRTSLGLQGIFLYVPRFKARKTVLFLYHVWAVILHPPLKVKVPGKWTLQLRPDKVREHFTSFPVTGSHYCHTSWSHQNLVSEIKVSRRSTLHKDCTTD